MAAPNSVTPLDHQLADARRGGAGASARGSESFAPCPQSDRPAHPAGNETRFMTDRALYRALRPGPHPVRCRCRICSSYDEETIVIKYGGHAMAPRSRQCVAQR